MELVDRIKVVMKVNQLSATQLADEIGVQRSNVSHVLSGRNKPSFEFLSKLLNRFPKVNADWLITGKSLQSEKEQTEESLSEGVKPAQMESPAMGAQTHFPDERIERIIVFYNDGTFRQYNSRME